MTDLKELLITRLERYDSSLDLSEGSVLMTSVIDPIVSVFGTGSLTQATTEFLTAKLEEAFPDVQVSAGDAIYDILISGCAVFFEAYRKELNRIANAQSIANLSTISDADVDALAANWLVSRNLGAYASCRARLIFPTPTSVRIDSNNLLYTASGLVFRPDSTYVLSAGSMRVNQLTESSYYLDITIIASEPGAQYNIGVGAIVGITGSTSVASVSNTTPASGGRDRESNETMIRTRLPQAVSERSLVSARGIRARLISSFPDLLGITVIGFGDPEMTRDLAVAEGDGPLVLSGFAFLHPKSMKVILSYADGAASIGVGDTVKLAIPPAAGSPSELESVVKLLITSVELEKSSISLFPRTYTAMCTVAGSIPTLDGEWVASYASLHRPAIVHVNGEEVNASTHLGGNTDIYVHPLDDTQSSLDIPLHPTALVYTGTGVSSTVGTNRIVLRLGESHESGEFKALKIIRLQGTSGLYTIRHVEESSSGLVLFLNRPVDISLSTDAGTRWYLYNELSTEITRQRQRILPLSRESLTCSGVIGTTDLRITTPIDVLSVGIDLTSEDYVLSVDIDGTEAAFRITGIQGDTISVGSGLRATIHNKPCEIYALRSAVPLPLTHIQSISVAGRPTPYGRAYGGRVLHLGGARMTQSGLVGLVAPKYDTLFAQLATPAIASLDMDLDSYLAAMSADYGNEVGHLTPFAYGIAAPRAGAGVLRYRYMALGEVRYAEVALPLDLFLPGDYTVFIAHGNTSYDEVMEYITTGVYNLPANMDYPVQGERGDTLSIEKGPNAGEYIIDEVFNIELRVAPAYEEGDVELYQGDRDDLAGLSGDPSYVVRRVDTSKVIRLSVVRVLGKFTSSPLATYEEAFSLAVAPSEISPADNVIDIADLVAMLMDPSKLISSTSSEAGVLAEAAQSRLGLPVSADLGDIGEATAAGAVQSYSVGKPARGIMRVYHESEGHIRFPQASPPRISHGRVNRHLYNKSAGNSDDHMTVYEGFKAVHDTLQVTLDASMQQSSLIYGGEGVSADRPLTWRRDLDISNVSADLPDEFYIPDHVVLNGRSPSVLSQDEDRVGIDLVTLPDDVNYPVVELELDQYEELRIHKEAVFPDYSIIIPSQVTVKFTVFPSTTDLDITSPYLVSRKGIAYIEPAVIPDGYIPSWWLGEADPDNVRLALNQSRQAATPLSYVRLNDIPSLEDFVYTYTLAAEGVSPADARNIYGRTLVEELEAVALADPRAVIAVHTEGAAINGLPTNVTEYIEPKGRYRVYGSLEAITEPSDMLLGVTVSGSNRIELVNPLGSGTVDSGLDQTHVGAYLFIDSGSDRGAYTITAVDGEGSVAVDRPLAGSTAVISAKGSAAIQTTDAVVNTLIMSEGALTRITDDGDFIPRAEGVHPAYITGGAAIGSSTRLLVESDAGKYITLYSFVRRPDSSLYSEGASFTPVRTHLGCFKVTSVTPLRVVDGDTGDNVHISSTIKVEGGITLPDLGEDMRDYEEVFFLLTEDPVPPEDEQDLKCAVQIHIYETEASVYRIVGLQPDISGQHARSLAISTEGYDVPSSSSALSPFNPYNIGGEVPTFVNISMDLKNPYAIVKNRAVTLPTQGTEVGLNYTDVPIQSMGHSSRYNEVGVQTFTTSGEQLDGYVLDVSSEEDTFSSAESTRIVLNPMATVNHLGLSAETSYVNVGDDITIDHVHSPTVNSVQSLVTSGVDRVVCSDIRVKRMLPAYVGAQLRYTGAANPFQLKEAIRVRLKNAIMSGSPISKTTLITTAYEKGATEVSTALLYYYVIDRNRVRRVEIVDTDLSPSSLTVYNGTIRTTGLSPATLDSPSLGAEIDVIKSRTATRIGRGI